MDIEQLALLLNVVEDVSNKNTIKIVKENNDLNQLIGEGGLKNLMLLPNVFEKVCFIAKIDPLPVELLSLATTVFCQCTFHASLDSLEHVVKMCDFQQYFESISISRSICLQFGNAINQINS